MQELREVSRTLITLNSDVEKLESGMWKTMKQTKDPPAISHSHTCLCLCLQVWASTSDCMGVDLHRRSDNKLHESRVTVLAQALIVKHPVKPTQYWSTMYVHQTAAVISLFDPCPWTNPHLTRQRRAPAKVQRAAISVCVTVPPKEGTFHPACQFILAHGDFLSAKTSKIIYRVADETQG